MTGFEQHPTLRLWVPGRPKTKGSLDFVGGHVVENVAGSKRWRQLVAYQVEHVLALDPAQIASIWPWPGPVAVACVFHMPVTDVTRARSGDLDKLMRNVLDALQDAGMYGDDVAVTRAVLEKVPAGERGPGLDLTIVGLPS